MEPIVLWLLIGVLFVFLRMFDLWLKLSLGLAVMVVVAASYKVLFI